MEELIMMPMLIRGKIIELASFGLVKAFKKNTKEQKFGIPREMPQKILFNCNGFFNLICLPEKVYNKTPVIAANMNNIIKNKYPPWFGNPWAKSLNVASEIP